MQELEEFQSYLDRFIHIEQKANHKKFEKNINSIISSDSFKIEGLIKEANKLFELTHKYIEKKEYDQAKSAFNKLIEKYKKVISKFNKLGLTNLAKKTMDKIAKIHKIYYRLYHLEYLDKYQKVYEEITDFKSEFAFLKINNHLEKMENLIQQRIFIAQNRSKIEDITKFKNYLKQLEEIKSFIKEFTILKEHKLTYNKIVKMVNQWKYEECYSKIKKFMPFHENLISRIKDNKKYIELYKHAQDLTNKLNSCMYVRIFFVFFNIPFHML